MILIAIVLPCLYFLMTGRLIRAIIALLLMCTVLGWPIASLWAIAVRNDAVAKNSVKAITRAMEQKTG
jgi:hypothetical protein